MGLGIVSMIGVVSLWSITYVFIKIALRVIDPYTLAFLRLAQGAIVLIILYKIRGGKWRELLRKEKWLLIGGTSIAVNQILLVLSLDYTTASAGGLVVQFQFVTLAVLSILILRETFSFLKTAGILTILCGIILIFSTQGTLEDILSRKYVLGNTLMLVSAIGWGTYALASKALSARLDSLTILIPILTIGAVAAGAISIIRFEVKSIPTAADIVVIVVLGVFCTGVTNALLAVGLKRLSASVAGSMTGATPLLNMLLANWVLGEQLTPLMFVSAVLIILGILGLVYAEWRMKVGPSVRRITK
jgi:drug/metabolite transporter (DMT)-like permease